MADKFPVGMRVLAVDDNPVCLKIMEATLRFCKYHATVTNNAETALQMLRERPDDFDLVISDVHMPDMDGFKLLELIGLEMDLPVIMLSASGDLDTMMKGVTHGACDYLTKPVTVNAVKNIWQHVLRNVVPELRNNHRGDSDGDHQKVQSEKAKDVQVDAGRPRKYSRKKRSSGDDHDENKENELPTQKKSRVIWSSELHKKFVRAVNQLGVDRAVPKKVLHLMNVDYITRENVASHLQKYRLYLKRINTYTSNWSNKFSDVSARWNSVNELGCLKNYHEHGRYHLSPAIASSSSSIPFARMNSASALGARGFLPTQSVQLRNGHGNLGMGTVGHGGSLLKQAVPDSLPDARKCFLSGLYGNSVANVAKNLVLDLSKGFLSGHLVNPNAGMFCDQPQPLETSNGFPSCHYGNSFASMPSGGFLAPANQFPVQSPVPNNQPLVQMNPSSSNLFSTLGNACQFPGLGNCSGSWQTAMPSRFPAGLGHKDGTYLGPSQENIPNINQPASFAASHGQIPMFGSELHGQMPAIMSSTPLVAGVDNNIVPFNIGNNISPTEMLHDTFALGNASNISSTIPSGTSSTEMLHGNFALANASNISATIPSDSSISYMLPNLQIDGSVVPTQMLNAGGADGILPVLDGSVDQQAFFDQPGDSNGFPTGTNGPAGGTGELDDIVAGLLNHDFAEGDDAFIDWEQ
ncbi:hypothetical protein GUJ93_ZPchr0006g42849 [Zizania palustris]|uniref:Two-component response regulator n=1 Tax=Zizania palustris TaxID=103762 RepID=A0A8J5SFR8_ZIZPA|nr:hypothetical protein GUJ93_ZPchr0006g42849 [Zizania palustris]